VSPAPVAAAAPAAVTSIADPVVTEPPAVAAPVVGTARVAGPTVFVPYEPTVIGVPKDLAALATDELAQAAVRQTLRQIIAVEGPIEQQRLARLTLARYGFASAPENRKAAVLALVDPATVRTHPTGTYVWPPGLDPATWRGFRASRAGADRTLVEVAPEEIANAIGYALVSAPSRVEEDLLRTALDLLGYRRKTEKVESLLRYGLRLAYQAGRVARDDDGRYIRPA
jgi:hypothetical protein